MQQQEERQLKLINKQNSSSCEIYEVLPNKQSKSQKTSILKLINHATTGHNRQCKHLYNEFQILKTLDHPNIIKLQLADSSYFQETNNKQQGICGLHLERCKTDIYALLQKTFPKFIELKQNKAWFFELASALDYLHDLEICHFDLKLENLFINEQNKAILGDFGLSQAISKLSVKSKVITLFQKRSKQYFSPEASQLVDSINSQDDANIESIKNKIDWKKIDVFAFGMCIFQAVYLTSPYEEAEYKKNDKQFQNIVKKDFSKFWKSNPQFEQIQKQLIKSGNSIEDIQQMQNLLQQLMEFDPSKRPSFKQILQHPWFK